MKISDKNELQIAYMEEERQRLPLAVQSVLWVLPSRYAAHGKQKSLFSVSAQQGKRSRPLPRPDDHGGRTGGDVIRNPL